MKGSVLSFLKAEWKVSDTIYYQSSYGYTAFNIFQVHQYFTIYRRYFFLKFEYFMQHYFKLKRYQLPF
jgi:hypothetical protein